MHAPQYFEALAKYNRWFNDRLYGLCAEIPDADRKADRRAFFRSIHGTLNHILLADRVWLGRFNARAYPAAGLDQELYSDFDELRRERAMTDTAITIWTENLTEEKLAGTLTYTAISRPAECAIPFWHAALHLFNHQAHHRGQTTTLLMQMGIDPGVTDLLHTPNL